MREIRLCLLFPHVLLGGGETAMMEVAEGLEGAFDLEVCAFDQGPLPGEATIREELSARFRRVTFLRQRWQLRRVLGGCDVVLWYGVVHQVPKALRALHKQGRRPVSVRVVHTERPEDGHCFQRRWQRQIDGVIAVSPTIARRIPGAVFIPNTCSSRHLRGRASNFFPPADPPRKTLGFLGRLVPLKNVRWLVEHVADVGCNLLLQGLDTELLTAVELERLAAQRGHASRVRFLPPDRDVGTLLRSVDALVIASEHEGFPMVVVEAGMLGVPVISTRVGALPELFGDEILFIDRDGDVPSIASLRAAIERLERGWGESLRRKVTRLCARRPVVSRYAELLHQLVNRAPPSPERPPAPARR